jgi:hypothetical protein
MVITACYGCFYLFILTLISIGDHLYIVKINFLAFADIFVLGLTAKVSPKA